MRIAVANLTSGGLSGGYRKYLSRLMPLLAADRRVTSLTIHLPAEAAARLDGGLDVRPWARGEAGPGFRNVGREIRSLRPDVVFVPTARQADFGTVPVVSMVRNMEPLTVPFGGNSWREGLRNLARAWEARRACRRATRVIAVSEHVRDYIVSRWSVDERQVGTVYHGVEPPAGAGAGTDAERVMFAAGSIRPARGLEDAIEALALLESDVRLIVAGRVDPGCEPYFGRLRALADARGVSGRINWAGELEPEDMARMFLSSFAFIMTSRAEACPNTALEAMSCGCPAVSVDHAPMPEFFGDAAAYYGPGDAAALAHRLRTLISRPAEREALRTAAARRARLFTWEATRDGTIEQLQRAIS